MAPQTFRQRDGKTTPLRLVHAQPASWISSATLADTRAYVEEMNEAWSALAALSVPPQRR